MHLDLGEFPQTAEEGDRGITRGKVRFGFEQLSGNFCFFPHSAGAFAVAPLFFVWHFPILLGQV